MNDWSTSNRRRPRNTPRLVTVGGYLSRFVDALTGRQNGGGHVGRWPDWKGIDVRRQWCGLPALFTVLAGALSLSCPPHGKHRLRSARSATLLLPSGWIGENVRPRTCRAAPDELATEWRRTLGGMAVGGRSCASLARLNAPHPFAGFPKCGFSGEKHNFIFVRLRAKGMNWIAD